MDPADLETIARRHGIELLLESGSVVTGQVHPRSDLDLAVLAIINHADPLFLRKITERCRLLHGSPRRLAELSIYAFKRYQDHRRYLTLEREYVDRTLGRLSAP
jgi:hypothetical protein